MAEYHLVGDPITDQHPAVFELRVHDHIPYNNPVDYGLPLDAPQVDPEQYFITSGDAIEKSKHLSKILWSVAGKFKTYVKTSKPKGQKKAYEKELWAAAGKAKKLTNKLIEARGEACFLETEWRNHQLLCLPKNPRIK